MMNVLQMMQAQRGTEDKPKCTGTKEADKKTRSRKDPVRSRSPTPAPTTPGKPRTLRRHVSEVIGDDNWTALFEALGKKVDISSKEDKDGRLDLIANEFTKVHLQKTCKANEISWTPFLTKQQMLKKLLDATLQP
eukprot:TRINITY_DN116159_c0_g1_i1.p2 TRINITY_DN116159_c0_g1~~TRINITY_DN116159_c0_g1_i1.p2  ORF type:complete len:135 (+),score=35.34 TRINITY_DN116159_c0_g1_i1:3-407(+)